MRREAARIHPGECPAIRRVGGRERVGAQAISYQAISCQAVSFQAVSFQAVSLNSSRPISQRRISLVPAPISMSLASRNRRPVG